LLVGSRPSALETSQRRADMPENEQKLEVCHIASGDRWAGAEVQLATLLRALARRTDLRLCAILLNEGRLADEARQCGIDVCVLPESQLNVVQIALQASHFLHGRNVQVMHSHRYKENMLAAVLVRRHRIPVHVCSCHGAPEPFTGWRRHKQRLVAILDRFVAKYCVDCVVSVSEDLRKQLLCHLPKSKVVTIHNGIDLEEVFSPLTASEAKARLGIPTQCWVIGTVGRLDPIKRLDLFLSAARQVATAQPNARFILAGEGKEESSLRSLVADLGLEEHVIFLGHREDIYDVLRAMDILVLCSDHEGLPMALLETLYLRVPVVARPVGGVAEVIQDGVNGSLIHSAEPSRLARGCLQLLADEQQRTDRGLAGAQLVGDKFGVARTAAVLNQLYRKLSGVS